MKKLIFMAVILFSFSVNASHHKQNDLTNEEVVMKAYSTFAEGDNESWSKLHTNDLKFTVYGDLPQSGTHIGAEATIKNVFEVIQKHWPNFKLEKINIDTVGDTVYVLNHMTADNLDTYTLHMFKVKNGKIKSFTAFDDTDALKLSMIK